MKLVRPVRQQRAMGATASGAVGNDVAKAAIWMWYRSNRDKAVVKVAFITIRVRDLKVLFEMLAGPEPQ